MSWTPPPGTIGLTYAHGFAALRAAIGHRLLANDSTYTHAFVVLGNGLVIEPWPSGARVVPLDSYDGEDVAFGWLPGLPAARRQRIAQAAAAMTGIGHSLADYRALASYRGIQRRNRGRRRPRKMPDKVLRRLCRDDRLLPAQFVVEAYRRAEVYLAPDRLAHDVTLDQLGSLFLDPGAGWELRIPCITYV